MPEKPQKNDHLWMITDLLAKQFRSNNKSLEIEFLKPDEMNFSAM